MTAKLRIFQGDDESESSLSVSVTPSATVYPLRGAVGLYRYTTLLLWSCGILLVFILPVFATSLESSGFKALPGPMAIGRLPDGPASYDDQPLLRSLNSSLEKLFAKVDNPDQRPIGSVDSPLLTNIESLRLMLPHASLTPGSREYVTRTRPLAQILARRIQGSGVSLTLTVSSADRLSGALQFIRELPVAAAISSDRVALSVSDDVPQDFLAIEVRCPLPVPENKD